MLQVAIAANDANITRDGYYALAARDASCEEAVDENANAAPSLAIIFQFCYRLLKNAKIAKELGTLKDAHKAKDGRHFSLLNKPRT